MAVRFADLARPVFTPAGGPSTTLTAVAGLGALTCAALANPDTIETGQVLCPFRLLTGLPCPGCGLVRSWVYLAHGQWDSAMVANPFGGVAMVIAAVAVVAVLTGVATRRPIRPMTELLSRRLVLPVAVAWIVFGVARMSVAAGLLG